MSGDSLTLPRSAPPVAAIYVDWNVCQYLSGGSGAAFDDLLGAMVQARLARAAWVPYTIGHLTDATAGWPRLATQHRVARYRSMMFLEGLTGGVMWERQRLDDGRTLHRFVGESVLEAAETRALLTEPSAASAELVATELKRQLDDALREIRATAASSEHVPEALAESMCEELIALYGEGAFHAADAGRAFAAIQRPAVRHGVQAPDLDRAPADAVRWIDERLRRYSPSTSFDQLMNEALERNPALDPDDYGPFALAMFGYGRDARSAMMQARPGLFADQIHARFGLDAAIFMTGDKRLHRRLEAWAAHTGRGLTHAEWPVLLHIAPSQEAPLSRAVALVRSFAERFAGAVAER